MGDYCTHAHIEHLGTVAHENMKNTWKLTMNLNEGGERGSVTLKVKLRVKRASD